MRPNSAQNSFPAATSCHGRLRKATGGHGRLRGATGGLESRAASGTGLGGRQIALRWAVYVVGQTAVPTIFGGLVAPVCARCVVDVVVQTRGAHYFFGRALLERFLAHVLCDINILEVPCGLAGELVGTTGATVVGTQK